MSERFRRQSSPTSLEILVPGHVIANEHGSLYRADVVTPGRERRGGIRYADVLDLGGDRIAVAGRNPELRDLDLGKTAFVDTETTGLAGGTGTYAFLIGIGFFDGRDLIVRQFFMRDQSEEKAMMSEVGRELREFDWSVSFNGLSFDLPLLRTRFIMSRIRPELDHMAHFDLLNACRRIWGAAPFAADGGLRLGGLESSLLDHSRELDVPSWRVPEIYFDFLRSGDAGELAAVFAHNVEDILSMVSLLGHVDHVVGSWPDRGMVDPHAVVGIGRILELEGQLERAADAYALALSESLSPEVAGRAAISLSFIRKRLADWNGAVPIWQELAEGEGRWAAVSCVELAKYFEHREADFGRAFFYCLGARELAADLGFPFGGQLSDWGLEHRANRLKRRMSAAPDPETAEPVRPGAELSSGPLRR